MSRQLELPEEFVFKNGLRVSSPEALADLVKTNSGRANEVWEHYLDGYLEHWLRLAGFTALAHWTRRLREQDGGRDPKDFVRLFCREAGQTKAADHQPRLRKTFLQTILQKRTLETSRPVIGGPQQSERASASMARTTSQTVTQSKATDEIRDSVLRQRGALKAFLLTEDLRRKAELSEGSRLKACFAEVDATASRRRSEAAKIKKDAELAYSESTSDTDKRRHVDNQQRTTAESSVKAAAKRNRDEADKLLQSVHQDRDVSVQALRGRNLGPLPDASMDGPLHLDELNELSAGLRARWRGERLVERPGGVKAVLRPTGARRSETLETSKQRAARSKDDLINALFRLSEWEQKRRRLALVIAVCVFVAIAGVGVLLYVYFENAAEASRQFASALSIMEAACKAGDRPKCATAQYNIGCMYYGGEGVSMNYREAFSNFRQAADMGNVDAMTNVGILYRNGQGVTRDFVAALRWLRKAADAGDGWAMNSIGTMYESGDGVNADRDQAMRWYRKAAAAGDQGGSENLARLGAQ